MFFQNLAERLEATFHRLRARGKLTEADVVEALREVRLALLEADVNFRVVKDFIGRVKEEAVGSRVLESLTPGQQVVKIVHEELTKLMGGAATRLELGSKTPAVIMLIGLQGSGKTTTAGKLANYLRKQGRHPLLVAADPYRPAAAEQLMVLGRQLGIPVFAPPPSAGEVPDPVHTAAAAVQAARLGGQDVVIVDTAGRLHVDDELMAELARLKTAVEPREVLLVVDAMTGQDALTVAEAFDRRVGVDGLIMTKLDGDARGGAALSARAITGRPIKFAGVGEKLDALEPFHPDRLASRILGMGDVLSLIEKAEQAIDVKKAEEMKKKLLSAQFTLDDFLEQLKQVRRMGPLDQVLGMIPGLGNLKKLGGLRVEERELVRAEAIISSMTSGERRTPDVIDGSRRKRIATGSGTSVQDVNRLLRQFGETRKMLRQFADLEKGMRHGKFPFPMN
jgi:signal recognition particle subunit SRP54